MASYDYGYRSGYSNGKGAGPRPNEWSKTSYADDECRTVIVDADGTQRTIIGCTPLHNPGAYVTKTETIIQERILSPAFPAAYKHSSPPTVVVEPVKQYGYADDKWRRPSSPVKGYGYSADDHKLRRPSSPEKGYGYSVDDYNKLRRPSSPLKGYGYPVDDHNKLRRPSSPVKGYGYPVDDYNKLHKPSSPVKGYGYAADDQRLRRPSSPEHDYPQEVGNFLTKVHTEASRDQPSRVGPLSGVNWRQPPQQTGHNGTTGYGDYSDYNNKPLYKPNGNTNYDDYHRKNDSGSMGPTMRSNGARPIRSTWAPPAPGHEGRLTTPTDDMETALRYLKESAKRDEYQTDAAKRNVRFNVPSWP
ncbi:uncharacterized protein LOC110759615 [Prunus avium]|uniref:Uncharacterized protein LOC110759615 n=1 Tax=Prunus avium TaxID=42229 RepID=A0A6P5SUS3_PRUAV|nr:uncharacterized protein LOC110759615 [Prunus avium]